MGKDDAWGAVNLADHHPLGAVDDKCSALRHERDIAHVNLFLTDFTGIKEHQVNFSFDGVGKTDAFVFALLFGEFEIGFIQRVSAIFEDHILIGAFNRKGRLEYFLQTVTEQRLSLQQALPLQKSLIGEGLDIDQTGNFHNLFKFGSDVRTFNLLVWIHKLSSLPHVLTIGCRRSTGRFSGKHFF